jgi:3D (Asp-Asp-Asp) domain-containing protein
VREIKLLVALSLILTPNAPSSDDKHKQPLHSMRGKARKFLAYAYTSGRLTSQGQKPIQGTTIAADPRVLPMGSRVKITGAGHYSGEYVVSDKGSKIKGRKVDIFVGSYQEARTFGRKDVLIEVLAIPKSAPAVAQCRGCGRNNRT